MTNLRFNITKKSFIYAVNIFLATNLCWYGLVWLGANNPIWAIITVILVSDHDFGTAMYLSKVRALNTVVGCVISLVSLTIFGYSPWASFLTVMATILFITSIENYPANWRLAPVTVAIIMDASRNATTYHDEIRNAIIRTGEITAGCIAALAIVAINIKLGALLRRRESNDPSI